MILKKFKKHSKILKRRFAHKKVLKSISTFDNQLLQKVLEAYLTVKTANISSNDLAVFSKCEKYRQQLSQDETVITYEIFGSDRVALVKDISKSAASATEWCQLLYYFVQNTEDAKVLEIGTNLGVSGTYILEALKNQPNSEFVTMEGLAQLCAISSNQFQSIVPKDKFQVLEGLYDQTFPQVIQKNTPFNVLFIDGNHQKEPTIEYFNKLKDQVSDQALFIFDDINWSVGMQEAWSVIKNNEDVNYAIDLYEQGIIILDKNDANRNVNFALHLAY